MAQPSILDAGSKTKLYTSTDSSGNRTFDLDVPANANTVVIQVGLDADATATNIITGLTHTGLTGAVELFDIDTSADNIRAARTGIYDVRSCGAGTLEVTAALVGSATCVAAVVMTDGYTESFSTFVDRVMDRGRVNMHSGNSANNIAVMIGTIDADQSTFAFAGTGVTTLFKTNASGDAFAGFAGSQATSVNNVKTMTYSNEVAGDELAATLILFSSQPNAFGDIDPRGDIISHDIITN